MKIVAVFDSQKTKIGESINNLKVKPMEELCDTIQALKVRIGIITVPAMERSTWPISLSRQGWKPFSTLLR